MILNKETLRLSKDNISAKNFESFFIRKITAIISFFLPNDKVNF